MSACTGKWRLLGTENMDEFLPVCGLDAINTERLRVFLTRTDIIEDYAVTDTHTHRKMYASGKLQRDVKLKIGEPNEVDSPIGMSIITPIRISDTHMEVREIFQDEGGPDCKAIITTDGDSLTFTKWVIGGTYYRRKYQKEENEH